MSIPLVGRLFITLLPLLFIWGLCYGYNGPDHSQVLSRSIFPIRRFEMIASPSSYATINVFLSLILLLLICSFLCLMVLLRFLLGTWNDVIWIISWIFKLSPTFCKWFPFFYGFVLFLNLMVFYLGLWFCVFQLLLLQSK